MFLFSPDGVLYTDRDNVIVPVIGLRFRSAASFSVTGWRERRDGSNRLFSLSPLEVRSFDEIDSVVAGEQVVVGVLAVPPDAAQEVADRLVKAGVKIIFNYSERLLQVPPDVTVHTSSPAVDLLYALYFYLA